MAAATAGIEFDAFSKRVPPEILARVRGSPSRNWVGRRRIGRVARRRRFPPLDGHTPATRIWPSCARQAGLLDRHRPRPRLRRADALPAVAARQRDPGQQGEPDGHGVRRQHRHQRAELGVGVQRPGGTGGPADHRRRLGEGFFDEEGHPGRRGHRAARPARRKPLEKLGKRALPQGEVYLNNVRVPARVRPVAQRKLLGRSRVHLVLGRRGHGPDHDRPGQGGLRARAGVLPPAAAGRRAADPAPAGAVPASATWRAARSRPCGRCPGGPPTTRRLPGQAPLLHRRFEGYLHRPRLRGRRRGRPAARRLRADPSVPHDSSATPGRPASRTARTTCCP